VEQVMYEGTLRTNELANETLMMMKKAMGFTGVWNKISRKARKRISTQENETAEAVSE
jgi:tryptophanyl-tRNA synthetase